MGKLEVSLEEGCLLLRLNRPEARNALDAEMVEALEEALMRAAEDRAVQGVILTGAGTAFSAGADLSRFADEVDPRAFRWRSQVLSRVVHLLEGVEKPVVAAVNGLATGLGLALVLAADLRVASREARFAFREGRLGLLPSHGGIARLVRYVGLGRARDLLLGGVELDAEEAKALGLVTEVVPSEKLMEAARRRLEKALERAPLSYGLVKRLLVLATGVDLETALFLETLGQSQLALSEDHREGLRALKEKRSPHFRGQ
ncbi:enoyl-CoA hydratase/isomerase family protein [Thermus sp.]|uniref:enoyl-CoA hydratase/isomerase family protein n=1 Tax=Thermus sp. TaxID=275 RepID=UPI0025CD5E21|nr:enoyl-CoA hydratase/isomerase family protein [Thermus sp.]MCS6867887.1 enoyl-CoA hydratase/isomerase family protein [Thermus sp.]MDW8358461.1 enoyl-CoA hydratase/isomerase family protein [Thermus sp.]